MSTQPTREEKELLPLFMTGVNRDDQPVPVRTQPDQTLRFWGMLVGSSSSGETVVGLEPTGEQRVVMMGYDGTNLQRILVDDGRRIWQKTLHLGSVAGAPPDPVTLSDSSATTIFTCPSGYEAWVEVELANIDTVERTVDLFCDPTGTDTTTAFQILSDGPIPVPSSDNPTPVRLGPYNLGPAGTIKGQASAASAINGRVYVIKLEKLT
jgi:hypothetical protein